VLNEVLCWGFVALCGLYVAAPVDCLPEAVLGPFGYLDDAGAVFLAWQKVRDALKLRLQRRDSEGLSDASTASPTE
jgi:uncharacterized membrane protein YkvA (DUF1232 family)